MTSSGLSQFRFGEYTFFRKAGKVLMIDTNYRKYPAFLELDQFQGLCKYPGIMEVQNLIVGPAF